MSDEAFTASIRIWGLLTEHLQKCETHDCCVKDLVDNLDFEKDNVRTSDPQAVRLQKEPKQASKGGFV